MSTTTTAVATLAIWILSAPAWAAPDINSISGSL